MDQPNQPTQPNISPEPPQPQPNLQPEMPKKSGLSTWTIVLIIVLSVMIVGLVSYGAYHYFAPQPEPAELPAAGEEEITPSPLPTSEPDETADWQVYRNEEYGFEMRYPLELKENIDRIITIETIEEIRERYKKAQKEGGCPGKCGTLAANSDILEKQFEILAKIGECPYSDDFKNDIKENFILFQGGLGGIYGVESVYNDNLKKCGMKLIGLWKRSTNYGKNWGIIYLKEVVMQVAMKRK